MSNSIKNIVDKMREKKQSSFSYVLKKYKTIQKILKYISEVESEKIKNKLTADLKAYMAKELKINKNYVFLSGLEFVKAMHSEEPCAMIGNVEINLEQDVDMSNVKFIVGNTKITSPEHTVSFKSLENVYGDLIIDPKTNVLLDNLIGVRGNLYLENNEKIEALKIKRVSKSAFMANSAIKDLDDLESVGENLELQGSDIKNIASLKKAKYLNIRDTEIEKYPKEFDTDNCYVISEPHKFD